MNILLTAPQPFFRERGTPIAVKLLAQTLRAQGHRVHLLVYHEGDDVPLEGVTLHRIPPPPGVSKVPPGLSWKKIVCDGFLFLHLLRLLRRHAFDLVHAVEESVFMALVCKWWLGTPYVYDMDSCMSQQILDKMPQLRLLGGAMEWMERAAVRGSSGVMAVCRALADTAERSAPGKLIACIEDVPLPDVADAGGEERLRERFDVDGPLLMYVGNLETYQGIDLLLESFCIASDAEGKGTLVIIGGDPRHVARYRSLARREGILGRVLFLGPRPVSRLGFYLRQADILVSPRIQGNNTPMKIYSYLDSGRSVLATNLPTHTQVLDSDIACLVAPDPLEMAGGMRTLMGSRQLREEMGERARRRVQEAYSLSAFERKVRAFYDGLAREGFSSGGRCGGAA